MADKKGLDKETLEQLSTEERQQLKYAKVDHADMPKKEYTPKELEELRKQSEAGEKLTPVEASALREYQNDKRVKAVNMIIQGANDVWKNDYDFKEDQVKMHIEIKYPNVVEMGRIEAMKQDYLGGYGQEVAPVYELIYDTLATIRICGVKIPQELANDNNIYNLEWLAQIGIDFRAWKATFRY